MGVWIETSTRRNLLIGSSVTPFVGVWIETTWGEGARDMGIVTPFVGVWIETRINNYDYESNKVTPFVGVWIETQGRWSPSYRRIVTPFVGVWIETSKATKMKYPKNRHTLRGCVDWNIKRLKIKQPMNLSHPSWVCGLKLSLQRKLLGLMLSHTLRGCVDWNSIVCTLRWVRFVTPFVGVWIETDNLPAVLPRCFVTPFVGVWIETSDRWSETCQRWVTPFVGVWIETDFAPSIMLRSESHTLRGCVEWNRKQILFSEPTWKSHFYENVPLIVNKLQWQKIWFGTFLSGLSLVLYRNL